MWWVLVVFYSAAEAFYKQAIEMKENTLGSDHPLLETVSGRL